MQILPFLAKELDFSDMTFFIGIDRRDKYYTLELRDMGDISDDSDVLINEFTSGIYTGHAVVPAMFIDGELMLGNVICGRKIPITSTEWGDDILNSEYQLNAYFCVWSTCQMRTIPNSAYRGRLISLENHHAKFDISNTTFSLERQEFTIRQGDLKRAIDRHACHHHGLYLDMMFALSNRLVKGE